MLPSDYECPRCNCHACYALHRRGLDWLMTLFGLRPARCLTCSRRFYARYKLSEDGKYVLGGRSGAAEEAGTSDPPRDEAVDGSHPRRGLNDKAA